MGAGRPFEEDGVKGEGREHAGKTNLGKMNSPWRDITETTEFHLNVGIRLLLNLGETDARMGSLAGMGPEEVIC